MPGTAAVVVAGIVVFDTAAPVAAGTGESDTVAVVAVDTAASDIVAVVVAGTAALVVLIVYPSSILFRLPSDHLSTHLHPCSSHILPLGIMGSHVFAYMTLPKMVLFCTS